MQKETTKIQEYIRKKALSEELLSECLMQLMPSSLPKACTTIRLKKWLISRSSISGKKRLV